MKKRKIWREDLYVEDLKDPTGWTIENNPHKTKWVDDPHDELEQDNYFEYSDDGFEKVKCHCCILRAKYGSGNCQDNGEYFICLPKDVREGKRKLPKPTVQSKLF